MTTKADIKMQDSLREIYPHARPGFIKVMVEALSLHNRKEHDYNGKTGPKPMPTDKEVLAKFLDIRRKYERLYHIIIEDQTPVVADERTMDTAMDLGNYAFLFAEFLSTIKP
jgi:hypothetical protein